MKSALTWLLVLVASSTLPSSAGPAPPKVEQLVGTWHARTDVSEGTVTIRGDGTFLYQPQSGSPTIRGLWRLQGNAILWSYTPGVEVDGGARPDVNPIVELSPDRFVLREVDQSLSVFTRQSPPQPAGTSTSDPAQRLWAAAIVTALVVLAFLGWRLLRQRPPTPEDRIYPCLKETPWAALGPTVRRPLADVDGAEWIPWVAFGYDQPDSFVFLREDELRQSGRAAADVEAEALANLGEREASWQMVEIGLKDGAQFQVVMCTDDFFAAERILEPRSILDAQRRLGASALLAAVPRRGLLALIDADAGAAAIAWLVAMAASEHFGGESAPISPMVFRMSAGRIVGALPSPPRPAPASDRSR